MLAYDLDIHIWPRYRSAWPSGLGRAPSCLHTSLADLRFKPRERTRSTNPSIPQGSVNWKQLVCSRSFLPHNPELRLNYLHGLFLLLHPPAAIQNGCRSSADILCPLGSKISQWVSATWRPQHIGRHNALFSNWYIYLVMLPWFGIPVYLPLEILHAPICHHPWPSKVFFSSTVYDIEVITLASWKGHDTVLWILSV
jgi:hypothetical protein